ncbi:MAG: CopG family ribbon-helix-helix protein [Trueperaceae bacterium]|jgi:Arc/MetJ-type ribon-helix-helix transcriptional regulator
MMMSEERMARVTVTLPEKLLAEADAILEHSGQINRSRLVQVALRSYLREVRDQRLAAEAEKLDPIEEEALAEEGSAAAEEAWFEGEA